MMPPSLGRSAEYRWMALFANDTAAQRALRRRWLGEEIAADDDEIDKDARLGSHDVGRLVLSAVAVAAAMMTAAHAVLAESRLFYRRRGAGLLINDAVAVSGGAPPA
jgi:small-conductance mechanosensitive channel